MADVKINDLSLAGSITANMQFETDISGATANKVTAAQIKAYAETDSAPKEVDINAQTGTTYTLALSDAPGIVTMDNAGANTLTIPTNASVAFPTGSLVEVWQLGAGTTTVEGDTGVTLNGVSAGSVDLDAAYAPATLRKIDTDEWLIAVGGAASVA
jgi:hypothetical protein